MFTLHSRTHFAHNCAHNYHLSEGRLAHVEKCRACQMGGGDLRADGVDGHCRSSFGQTGERHGGEDTNQPVAVGREHGGRSDRTHRRRLLPRLGPRGDALALKQRQTQSPASGLAVQGAAAKFLIRNLSIGNCRISTRF